MNECHHDFNEPPGLVSWEGAPALSLGVRVRVRGGESLVTESPLPCKSSRIQNNTPNPWLGVERVIASAAGVAFLCCCSQRRPPPPPIRLPVLRSAARAASPRAALKVRRIFPPSSSSSCQL